MMMPNKSPWLGISGARGDAKYKAIIDNLPYSFDNDTCVEMKPILEGSMKELEAAVIKYDKEHPSSKDKKQIIFAKDIIVKNGFPEMRTAKIDDEKLLMLEAVTIILLSFHPEKCAFKYQDNDALITSYPEFESIGKVELDKLCGFANFMNFAFYFISANMNRQHIFNIVTRITEGKDVRYVTGTGKTKSTSDRVLIYNREGDVVPKTRPTVKSIDELEDIIGPELIFGEGLPIHEVFANESMIVPSPVTRYSLRNYVALNTSLGKRSLSMIVKDPSESSPSSIDLDLIIPGDDNLELNLFS